METIDRAIYNFNRDGRLSGRTDRRKKFAGTWAVHGDGLIQLNLKNGRYRTLQTWRSGDEEFAKVTYGERRPHTAKITSVTALD